MYEEILPICLIFTALIISNVNQLFASSEEQKYYPYELTYKLLTQSQIFTTGRGLLQLKSSDTIHLVSYYR